ncbi:cellulose binding domain-containing protein [Massilia sp. METH4]|uniref:cellulose binding domain-containing protein n=1 Tax=Massilia sp. METH4 TaxID=3123041 RepID=UPI0030D5D488
MKQAVALLAAALIACGTHAENYQWDTVAMGGGGYVTGIVTSKAERGVVYARTDVGGAYRWDARRSRWIALLDWVGEQQVGFQGIEALAVDPKNAANVYMLAGISYLNNGKTAILRSSDYGKTFTVHDVTAQFKAHGNGQGRATGEKLQVDPGSSNILYVGTRSGQLFRSLDSGATWSRLASFAVGTTSENGVNFVLLDPASVRDGRAQRIYVGVSRPGASGANLYYSFDGGATFAEVKGGPATLSPQRAVLSSTGKLYIAYADGIGPTASDAGPLSTGAIYEYNAVGGNWTNISPLGRNHPFGGISIDPADPKHLVASSINTWWSQGQHGWGDRIYTSRDAGRTWVDVLAGGTQVDNNGAAYIDDKAIHWTGSIEFDPFDTASVLVTSGNGLFRTANIDAATPVWDFNVEGLEETVPLNALSVPSGPLMSVIGDYDGFANADPATYGVQHTPTMGTTTGLAMAGSNPGVLARAGRQLYTSTNGGASWTQAPVINGSAGQVALSADGNILLHSPAGATTSYRSQDAGASWTAIGGLAVESAYPVGDPVNPARFYAYDAPNGRLLASTDGGASFVARAALPAWGSKLIRATPGREGHLWACADGLRHSDNAGASFTKVAAVASCSAVGLGKAAPGADYPAIYIWGTVGTSHGVLRSTDRGATWVRVNDDAHQYGGPGNGQFVIGDMNTYGTVYMSSNGRGIVYGKVDGAGDVPVTPAVPGGGSEAVNSCAYVKTSDWGSGHNAAIRITNNGTATQNGWKVVWTYPDNSSVGTFWNAAVSGNPPTYSAVPNQSWNTAIPPAGTVEFGITVSGAGVPTFDKAFCR